MMNIPDLDAHIAKYIQGGFGQADMATMKEECEKLKEGDVHLQIGIDEGRSLRVAHEYSSEGVYIVGIDIHDPTHTPGLNRSEFMEQEGMVGIDKRCFYVHGDADEFINVFFSKIKFISLLFIDGHHDYDSVKENTLNWEGMVKEGGVILFHDYDHPETKRWLDEHYKDDKEIVSGGKMIRVKK